MGFSSPSLNEVKANTCVNGWTGCLAQTKLGPTGCCLWAKTWTEAIDQTVLSSSVEGELKQLPALGGPHSHGSGIGELEVRRVGPWLWDQPRTA